mmetsp:Transcript_18403/g.30517  ORF Transcript_18403/g.30517 Transcript_18403/m.30517 type:complete len:205 (+) Transcript_18403:1911-2525(+)
MVLLSRMPSSVMLMPLSPNLFFTSNTTAAVTAWGFTNTNAWFLVDVTWGTLAPAIAHAFSMQGLQSMSSNRSKSDCFLPSNSTCGSLVQSIMVLLGMPAACRALPNSSLGSLAPTQFIRSASASNGEALACTPLSPTLGSLFSPRACHCSKIWRLREPASAAVGSVAPNTLPRKSSQDSVAESHSTNMYEIEAPCPVYFSRIAM